MSASIDDKTDPSYTIVLEDIGFWTFEEPGQLLGADSIAVSLFTNSEFMNRETAMLSTWEAYGLHSQVCFEQKRVNYENLPEH